MLRLFEIVTPAERADAANADVADGIVTMTFDERRRSRLLATLDDGRDAAIMLPRGSILRHGDRLRGDGGVTVEIRAAAESLSVATTADPILLSRAAYHLGNRHVPLQIGANSVAYAHDHVLDDMVRHLGLAVSLRQGPFEPEAGAFHHGAGGHSHGGEGHSHGGNGHSDGGGGHSHGDA
jgi:urease accessory protein